MSVYRQHHEQKPAACKKARETGATKIRKRDRFLIAGYDQKFYSRYDENIGVGGKMEIILCVDGVFTTVSVCVLKIANSGTFE